MKKVTLTDAECDALRMAAATLAGEGPDGTHLRTALVKLDRAAKSAKRRVEIALVKDGKTTRVLHEGLTGRWTANLAKVLEHAKWLAISERIVVRIDGSEVDASSLGMNEPI